MNQGKYVLTQLTEFLPQRVFDGIVKEYDGDKYIIHFSCWNQLLCTLFDQLTNCDSLRDLIITIEAHSKKSYHLGLEKSVIRSNPAKQTKIVTLKMRFVSNSTAQLSLIV
jgi:hypothetical protein